MNRPDASVFAGRKILLIGDVMLDVHYHGRMERNSAEAPIPIHDVDDILMNPGGAGNVAVNLKKLGIEPLLIGVTGLDYQGNLLVQLLNEHQIDVSLLLMEHHLHTIVKSRFYVDGRQLFRSDWEKTIPEETQIKLSEIILLKAEEVISSADMVLLQDYDKGIFNRYLIPPLLRLAAKFEKPVLVDPKLLNVEWYKGIWLLKPNLREFSSMMKTDLKPEKKVLDAASEAWMRQQQIRQLLVTLSENGIYFHDGRQSGIIPGYQVNQADVSGAGDTVLAVTAACALTNMSLPDTARYANAAGAYVCSRKGIVAAAWDDIHTILQ